MKITRETGLTDFEFWSGALDRVVKLTDEEMKTIESEIERLYLDGINETELNDLFWFDFEWVCELIGTDEETVLERE